MRHISVWLILATCLIVFFAISFIANYILRGNVATITNSNLSNEYFDSIDNSLEQKTKSLLSLSPTLVYETRGEDYETALHTLAKNGNVDLAAILIENMAEINARTKLSGQTAIHIATRYNNIEVLQLLLENGGMVDSFDYANGQTALHYAVQNDNIECYKLLIDWGANEALVNIRGESPLVIAKRYQSTKLLKYLKDNENIGTQ